METYCDSDEEVFFGPVTLKEVKKALSLRRRTEKHEPMTTVEADTRRKPEGNKEELVHNLTFTSQMKACKEKEVWNRRSLDENAVKLFTDEEAPAPPPSPEKMDYNGSPFPTPCNPRKLCRNSLHHITEEDEVNKQSDGRDRVSKLSRLSILTTMNDSLTDGLQEPLSAVQEQFEGEGSEQGPTEETTNGRNILLEKMKEYESQEQQIKSMKKASLHKVALEDSLAELSTDDLLILNDVENDYFSEEISSSPASLCGSTEVQGNPTGSVPACKELPRDFISDLRFSRLVSERTDASHEDDLAGFSSNFLADCERRYGKHRLDEVLASLSSEEESPERSASTSDASPERIRPMSPEYNIAKRSESRCSTHSSAGEVSLPDSVEISILDEGLSTEVEQLSCGIDNISMVDEGVYAEASPAADENNSGIETSVRFNGDLSEQADIISYEYELHSKEDLKQTSPECNEDSIMTDVTGQASLQTEVESISHTTETTSQDCSYLQTSLSNRTHETPSSNQEYTETDCTKATFDFQKTASIVGGKTYIMSDEYSLISDAESDCYTPNKREHAYSAEPCVNLASFDEKIAASVDKDGGFLSVLSEAALLHASLAQHSASNSGKRLTFEQEAQINSTHNQIYENSTKCGNDSSISANHGEDMKESNMENVNLSSHISYDGMQTDYCAGETNALDDLSDTDLEHAAFALSADTEKFNDTLEEMEMLLKYGYSYQVSSNVEDLSICHESTDAATLEAMKPNQLAMTKDENPNIVTEPEAKKVDKLRSTFEVVHSLPDCLLSPVPHKSHLPVVKKDASPPKSEKLQPPLPNKTKAGVAKELGSPFKVPAKPVSQATSRPGTPRVAKQKPTHLTPAASSAFKKPGYKTIVSPVGMYIHNTPSPSLVTNVKTIGSTPRSRTTKTCTTPTSSPVKHNAEKFMATSVPRNNAENIDINNICPILPVVSYKSAPALKLDAKVTDKLPKINERMKKLIDTPRPHVIRHEGRVKIEPIPQMKKFASPKQSKCTDNSFNASDPEISVVVEKKATRTNTVGI